MRTCESAIEGREAATANRVAIRILLMWELGLDIRASEKTILIRTLLRRICCLFFVSPCWRAQDGFGSIPEHPSGRANAQHSPLISAGNTIDTCAGSTWITTPQRPSCRQF